MAGALPILRPKELCGDVPNIPVYQHALRMMDFIDGLVAVQANSPTVHPDIIRKAKDILEAGMDEVKSPAAVWGISYKKLTNYGDPYKPDPDIELLDDSIDIHTQEDYELALKQYEQQNIYNR